MPELPTGTVTFLFTDVEGSTRLWEQQPEMMRQVLVRHDAIIEEAVAQHAGVIVRPRGEGDSRFAVFARPSDAVAAAVAIQQALHGETWPLPAPFRVRMALHTGEADLRDGDYYGSAVNRCARLRAITHGGQTLVSQATAHLIRDGLPLDAGLRDLGDQRLSDLSRPERVYQLLHPDLPAEFPPLRSLTALPHNLPLQLTSFIGRERELGELTRRLQTARLLTLTGSGGAGKTRLALQVAAELVPRYPDGVWLAELAPLADPALVRRTVAAAVGVREAPGQAILDTLLAALREKRLLLVLDNCEHVLDACARLADALLRGCPGVQLLAASREALGVAGEVSWRVPSLAVPSLEQRVAHEQVAEYDAVQLFVERAQAALPSFSITAQNAMALAQVCARLDGIPLALELAAARVKGLTVDQLADRLHDRFRLLTGGSRAALPRQQTLRAAIDWSYDLLDEAEQRLFRRLAVFAGGWTVEAAEAVCAGDGLAHEDVLDILLRLVDKSLALAEERRYRLLETVRQYGRDRLAASGEAGAVYARHAAFYLALAEELEPQFMLGGPTIGRDGLVAEIDNQRAALNWYADSDDVEAVLRLAGALLWYWFFQGYAIEGQRWLHHALARRDEASARVRAHALYAAGVLAFARGEYVQAEALLCESVAGYQQLGDQREIALALLHLGAARRDRGSDVEANTAIKEALELAREIGDHVLVGTLLMQRGIIERERGDLDSAQALFEETLALLSTQTLESPSLTTLTLQNLGALSEDQHDYVKANAYLNQSLILTRRTGNRFNLPFVLESVASLAAIAEQPEHALRLASAAAALRERLGMPVPPTWRPRIARTLERARVRLDPATAAAAWAEGGALTPEQALDYALNEETDA